MRRCEERRRDMICKRAGRRLKRGGNGVKSVRRRGSGGEWERRGLSARHRPLTVDKGLASGTKRGGSWVGARVCEMGPPMTDPDEGSSIFRCEY